MKARIVGTGSYLPEKELTNFELEKMVDTSNDWIVSRTGIETRRIAADDQSTSDMATIAAQRAMDMAGVKAEDIDMIVLGTITGDYPWPATACIVQTNLGAKNAYAYDVSAACSGFLYALSSANDFLTAGRGKRALVIGAETLSRIIDWEDRNTCVLFGDGAGAFFLKLRKVTQVSCPVTFTRMAPTSNYCTNPVSGLKYRLLSMPWNRDRPISRCKGMKSSRWQSGR